MAELYVDTANLEEIKDVLAWGIITGCTTNPMIVAKEKGCIFDQRMKEILKMVDGPVSIEVTTNNFEEMIKEAEEYSKWGNNVVVKIPMGVEGLKATAVLKKKGIKTNVTACMSVNQAMAAAMAGATYVSLFYGRIGDMGSYPEKVIEDTKNLFVKRGFHAKIIVGSIRSVNDVNKSMIHGADIVTVAYPILKKMAYNPQTEKAIDEFLQFWEEFKKG